MNPTLRNLLLSALLIAVPAGGFAFTYRNLTPRAAGGAAPATTPGLGDLSAYRVIVAETQAIADRGDMAGAELRITDLEVLWDDNASALRAKDRGAWTVVDDAADAVFAALRTKVPDPMIVAAALDALDRTLVDPTPIATGGALQTIQGIAVTDDTGHPLPCEEMIGTLRTQIGAQSPATPVQTLLDKALERCKADDDGRADSFAAQALALLKG